MYNEADLRALWYHVTLKPCAFSFLGILFPLTLLIASLPQKEKAQGFRVT